MQQSILKNVTKKICDRECRSFRRVVTANLWSTAYDLSVQVSDDFCQYGVCVQNFKEVDYVEGGRIEYRI